MIIQFNNTGYALIIILMIITMVIYGGAKKYSNSQIEYNLSNHKFVNSIELLETKLNKYNVLDRPYVKVSNKINLSECFIPNIQNIFYININPKKHFDIKQITKLNEPSLMVLYLCNIQINNYHAVFIDSDDMSVPERYGYYYQLTNKISILDIYPIFNNSDKKQNICVFIIKKSFWYL
jgi:hypothetical protein